MNWERQTRDRERKSGRREMRERVEFVGRFWLNARVTWLLVRAHSAIFLIVLQSLSASPRFYILHRHTHKMQYIYHHPFRLRSDLLAIYKFNTKITFKFRGWLICQMNLVQLIGHRHFFSFTHAHSLPKMRFSHAYCRNANETQTTQFEWNKKKYSITLLVLFSLKSLCSLFCRN